MRTIKIWFYIFRAHIAPFIFSTLIIMALFMLQFLMKNIDELAGKGIGAWVITQLIMLNLAWMVVLAVPMGVLIATLMAYGNLSSTNEITAMKASGASALRLMLPALVLGAVVTFATFLFDNDVLPDANHKARLLFTDIQQKKPTFAIEAGKFSNAINGYSILALKTNEYSNLLEGVTIYDYSQPDKFILITAEQGTPSFTQDYSTLVFTLERGEIHQLDRRDMGEYRAIRFDRHQITMPASGFQFIRTNDAVQPRGDREMNIATMRTEAEHAHTMEDAAIHRVRQAAQEQFNTLFRSSAAVSTPNQAAQPSPPILPPGGASVIAQRAEPAFALQRAAYSGDLGAVESAKRTYNSYMVEIYKKYSIPFACLIFAFVGAPLGILVRRGTFGMSAGISLAFFVVYWACLIGGEKLADRDFTSPFMGMWIANILIGALGIYLIIQVARESPALSFTWFVRLRGYFPARRNAKKAR